MGEFGKPAYSEWGWHGMKDDAYSLELLPGDLKQMSFTDANAIEANLQYLILLFPYFSGTIRQDAIGSYSYLELTEAGRAGDGFSIESAIRIDKIKITVTGVDLGSLSFQGAGWISESMDTSSLVVAYTSDEFMTPAKIQEALNDLHFTATADLDSTIMLQVSNTVQGDFSPVGPVKMFFRGGATWALVEGKALTWGEVEDKAINWNALENLKK